jgi:hypothetical protein
MGRAAMPSDLSVKTVGPVPGASENPAGPKPGLFTPPAQGAATAPSILVANPTLRFDVASGLVVIEFHDAAGDVTTSVPTLRQLEAYRIHSQSPPGQSPPGQSLPGQSPTGQSPPHQASPAAGVPAAPAIGIPASPATGVHPSATLKV